MSTKQIYIYGSCIQFRSLIVWAMILIGVLLCTGKMSVQVTEAAFHPSYHTFECGSGAMIPLNLHTTTGDSAWGEGGASHLIDNDPYTGWATNYNSTTVAAVADIQWTAPHKVKRLYIYVDHIADGEQGIVKFSNGADVRYAFLQAGNNLSWMFIEFNSDTPTTSIQMERSDPHGNIFEVRVCAEPVTNCTPTITGIGTNTTRPMNGVDLYTVEEYTLTLEGNFNENQCSAPHTHLEIATTPAPYVNPPDMATCSKGEVLNITPTKMTIRFRVVNCFSPLNEKKMFDANIIVGNTSHALTLGFWANESVWFIH